MMALAFLFLILVILLVWFRKRQSAIYLLLFTLVFSLALFIHHFTTHLNLNL